MFINSLLSVLFEIHTVWSIWFVTLQTCITRPADMIESCAIAYLKDFLYAFMLYFIPILPYFTNSVIFAIKMKAPTPQICQKNSLSKSVKRFWLWGALSGRQQRSDKISLKSPFGHKENNLRPLTETPSTASSSALKIQEVWPEEAKPRKTDTWQSLLKISSGSTTTLLPR